MSYIIELNAGFEFKNKKSNKIYIIEKLIGNGGFADAFLVRENKTKKKYRYLFPFFFNL